MSKITFKNKKGEIIITNRLSYPETVNERIYNAIASGVFEGFLPVTIQQKKKETRIECVVKGLVPYSEYFKGIINREMFLSFVHEIALLIKTCEKNMISANNLDLQRNRIFVDLQTNKYKCIFWPVVNNSVGNPPQLFLKQLPFDLNFDPCEDNGYLEIYKDFFNGMTPFSITNFDKMVLKLLGKESIGGHIAPSEVMSGALRRDTGSINTNKVKKKIDIEYDPFAENLEQAEDRKVKEEDNHNDNGVFCPSCGIQNQIGANFCIKCGTEIKRVESIEEEKLKIDNNRIDSEKKAYRNDSEGTVVLSYNDAYEQVYPTLKRVKTGESCSIDKPIVRIGKGDRCCDYTIYDNRYISRIHANIITRDGRYYIIDQKSTNKTYIDGKAIQAEKEVEIFAGTRIRLANEEFVFNIEE